MKAKATPGENEAERAAKLEHDLGTLSQLLGPTSAPNINTLWRLAKDLEGIKLNIKQSGYDLARRLADDSRARPVPAAASPVGLTSKACVQTDIDSEWFSYWASQLKIGVIYHRKIWEYCYLLQALFENGMLSEGAKGLGFACGQEPIPSLLARLGCHVTMSDLPEEQAKDTGWISTRQHASHLDAGFRANIVDRPIYAERVSFIPIDMNAIPADLAGFDFCWSLCSMEHLGSISSGLDFVENSLRPLKPGGIAVHTTEYNFLNDAETIDNWGTVLFQRRHFEALAQRLAADGHAVAPLDFNVGDGPMDRFIDLPPYAHDLDEASRAWLGNTQHLKLLLDGFASTCFGLIIKKSGTTQ
ncbi:MAG: methyltransferase domain-containing protein [Hyphomicrobiaceae bacterium]